MRVERESRLTYDPMMTRCFCCLVLVCFSLAACRIVPRNRRQHLADPTMQSDEDVLRDKARSKMHTAREGSSGGDGEPAGGGCGCSN